MFWVGLHRCSWSLCMDEACRCWSSLVVGFALFIASLDCANAYVDSFIRLLRLNLVASSMFELGGDNWWTKVRGARFSVT